VGYEEAVEEITALFIEKFEKKGCEIVFYGHSFGIAKSFMINLAQFYRYIYIYIYILRLFDGRLSYELECVGQSFETRSLR